MWYLSEEAKLDASWEVVGKALELMASGVSGARAKKDFVAETKRVKFEQDLANAVDPTAVLDIIGQRDRERATGGLIDGGLGSGKIPIYDPHTHIVIGSGYISKLKEINESGFSGAVQIPDIVMNFEITDEEAYESLLE